MCGIAGIIEKKRPLPLEIVPSFQNSLRHRGPDDQGSISLNKTSLVHTRLSIIDVAGGHQPLADDSNRVLIGNGEIYNYLELKHHYAEFPYKCSSDMEVVFPLYHQYGPIYAQHLRGMFALALYDSIQDRLVLSRDPYGIKPLYYINTDEIFAFASEIQAFIKAGLIKAALNVKARDEVLQLRFNTHADTPFKQVKRLLPGETLVLEKGEIINRFVHTLLPKIQTKLFLDKALDQFDQALSESVKVHLRSDVPYGLFLSGGLDSAAILKLMQRHTSQPIKTFTIGFDKSTVHDERLTARHLAQSVGAEHQELHFTEEDFWQILPKVVSFTDDLILDQAMLPTYKLAQEAAQHVKVVLCGEGGDEMLAGYRRYQKANLPWWLGGRLIRQKGVFHKLDSLFTHDLTGWREGLEALCEQESFSTRSRLQIAQAVDCKSWLANNLLIKLDRCLMAHGVEGRTPLLDPAVTAASFALSDPLKIQKGYGKWLLRKWLEKHFPEAHPFEKKRGFRVPVVDWILAHKERLSLLMRHQESIKQICDGNRIEVFFKTLTPNHEFAAWTLLVYALWHKHHIQGLKSHGDTFSYLEMK